MPRRRDPTPEELKQKAAMITRVMGGEVKN